MIFSQRDPLWADKFLGKSNLTIGEYGCTTTCLTILNNRSGANCTPDQVAEHEEWYTEDGLILWKKLKLKYIEFVWREYKLDLPRIRQYLEDQQNLGVMVELQLPKKTSHWVIPFLERPEHPGDFFVEDPWNGIECLNTVYGRIIGAAFFKKRVPPLP